MPRWTIAFDADDTLWHNERYFQGASAAFETLLKDYCDPQDLALRLRAIEYRNLRIYGFGIKGFTLSLIETAIEVSEGRVATGVINQILTLGREMLDHPVDLLPHVATVLPELARTCRLLIITKGDLLHQESKVARSGLGDMFDAVEIVSDKTAAVYQHIFARYDSAQMMMVGNSLKSDVIPALDVGVHGVWVPHDVSWDYENGTAPVGHPKYHEIPDLGDLPGLLARLQGPEISI